MNTNLHKLLIFCILTILSLGFTSNLSATCNWKSKNATFTTIDSCKSNINQAKFVGYIAFNNSNQGCLRYTWKINNTVIGYGSSFSYTTTKNGTYNICVTVRDTCNNCDTTYCASKTISCLRNTCAWYKRSVSVSWVDSCKGSFTPYSIGGSVNNGSGCYKYQWFFNNQLLSYNSKVLKAISSNGTYSLCLKISDTCDKCDTTICKSFTVTCVPSKCVWKTKNATLYVWDSCKSNGSSLNAELSFNGTSTSCFKYIWKVNNTLISYKTLSRSLKYAITQNGTYSVSVTVIDTCNNCDTTYTKQISSNCFSNSCKWSKNAYLLSRDSCNGKRYKYSIGGSLIANNPCFKYTWYVNNIKVSYDQSINYPISKNGTYNLCCVVRDTCNKCDTTYCRSFNVTCIGNTCNWKSRSPYAYGWDTCRGTNYRNSVNGYISFNYSNKGCFRYAWTVNGINIPGANNYVFSYTVTKNGTYNYCVKVTDTCNKCDTTFCFSKTVTCFPSCNWKGRNPYMYGWDTCKGPGNRNNVNAYISFNYSNKGCFRYSWSVNGTTVPGAKSYVLSYPITKNGTYNICVKVIDTCNNCDTMFCVTKNISCFPTCNWKKRLYTINVTDTCRNNKNENSSTGYIMLNPNMNNTCVKYTWKIDNVIVSNNYYFRTFIKKNGYHNYCVTMIDTCTKCDTTICFTRYFNCRSLSVNSAEVEKMIKVNPVPAQQTVTIESEIESSNAIVYDINGKVVWKGTIGIGDNQINIAEWSNGMYILTIMNNEGILTRKILKE